MKKIFIGLILLLNSFYAATAQSDKVNEKYDLYIDIGLKYAFDISGIALGLSIYSPSKKLSLSFRQDFLASIGAKDYYIGLNDSSNLFIQTNKIDFVRYHTQNYFELAYIVHPKITTSLGYGWVFAGSKENVRFNRDYGYPILSLAVSYQP